MMYCTSFTGYESWLSMGFVWHHVLLVQRHLAETYRQAIQSTTVITSCMLACAASKRIVKPSIPVKSHLACVFLQRHFAET